MASGAYVGLFLRLHSAFIWSFLGGTFCSGQSRGGVKWGKLEMENDEMMGCGRSHLDSG